jgi:carbohydrate-selective porin OprB
MDLSIGKRSKRRVAVAILVILGWAASAHAEDAPRAPAGTRDLAEIPFQLTLPRGHLLGDWLGARTWLEDHGVYPIVTFVTDALGNPTGGKQLGSRTSPSPSPSYRC